MAKWRIVEINKGYFKIQKLVSRPGPPGVTIWDSEPDWVFWGETKFSLRQAKKYLAKIKHDEATYPRVLYEEEF